MPSYRSWTILSLLSAVIAVGLILVQEFSRNQTAVSALKGALIDLYSYSDRLGALPPSRGPASGGTWRESLKVDVLETAPDDAMPDLQSPAADGSRDLSMIGAVLAPSGEWLVTQRGSTKTDTAVLIYWPTASMNVPPNCDLIVSPVQSEFRTSDGQRLNCRDLRGASIVRWSGSVAMIPRLDSSSDLLEFLTEPPP